MIQKLSTLILLFLMGFSLQAQEKITINDDLQLYPLSENVYVHTSWEVMGEWGRVPSNGLLVIKKGEALLIDTPASKEDTQALYEFVEKRWKAKITQFIAGHYHEDCIGGLAYLHKKGVISLANEMTISKCKELKLELPQKSFSGHKKVNFNGEPLVCKYFGGGHTLDNITVYFPKQQILFGGCLIKSMSSKGLGYTGEAVVEQWDTTVKKVQKAYPKARFVIPGHGRYGGTELLQHTIDLVQQIKK